MRDFDQSGAQRTPMTAYEPDHGPYRLRRSGDALWPPRDRAYGGQVETVWRRIGLEAASPPA